MPASRFYISCHLDKFTTGKPDHRYLVHQEAKINFTGTLMTEGNYARILKPQRDFDCL